MVVSTSLKELLLTVRSSSLLKHAEPLAYLKAQRLSRFSPNFDRIKNNVIVCPMNSTKLNNA